MKAKERKAKRRKEAEQRQEARANRTDVEQLAKLGMGGWSATREKARLNESIMATMEDAEIRKPQDKICEKCSAPFRGNSKNMTCPCCDLQKIRKGKRNGK